MNTIALPIPVSTGVLAMLRLHFSAAARRALQWRLLLLWLLALALPVLLAGLPLWLALSAQLDRALLGTKLVEGFDPSVLIEAAGGLSQRGYSPASALGALVVFLLVLPWLTGAVMVAARSPQPPALGALLKGGLSEYGRMARLWWWALIPLGVAAAATAGLLHLVTKQALSLTLASDADLLKQTAWAIGALLFVLAHASVDAARAQLVLEPRRRSVVVAWWRASKGLCRRPSKLLLYLLVTLAGLLLAAVLGWLRIQVAPVGPFSVLLAVLLGQAVVLTLGWMRCARLFALVAAGRS